VQDGYAAHTEWTSIMSLRRHFCHSCKPSTIRRRSKFIVVARSSTNYNKLLIMKRSRRGRSSQRKHIWRIGFSTGQAHLPSLPSTLHCGPSRPALCVLLPCFCGDGSPHNMPMKVWMAHAQARLSARMYMPPVPPEYVFSSLRRPPTD